MGIHLVYVISEYTVVDIMVMALSEYEYAPNVVAESHTFKGLI